MRKFSQESVNFMGLFKNCDRIVVKVGSSTLTHSSGALNLRRIEALARVLSDLKNSGKQIVLVSSGAVSAGVAKAGIRRSPDNIGQKQALAAIGQSELMKIYDRFFSDFGHTVSQILLTRDVLDNPHRRSLAESTFENLLTMGCVAIVNENDPVSTDELTKFGGNDILSAYVADVCHADILINLSDVDGLFDKDPRAFDDAQLVSRVECVTDEMIASAGGAGTERGTGGMTAKLKAAKISTGAGVPMFIMNGENPEILYTLLDGGVVGTYFPVKKD